MANILKPSGVNNVWSENGTKVDPGAVKVGLGWVVELPPYQTANFIEWKQDTFIAHVNQHGIPEWDSVTQYQGNASYTQGPNGVIYKCLKTHENKLPTDPANITAGYWKIAFENAGEAAKVQAALNAHLANYATLSGITNVVLARANLSVYSRAEGDARYAPILGSAARPFAVAKATDPSHAVPLSQINELVVPASETKAGIVRISTTNQAETGTDDTSAMSPLKARQVYLHKAGNLAGIGNPAAARANLGLGSASVLAAETWLPRSGNLAEVPDKALARANLGLTTTAVQPETYFLRTGMNLGDVVNKALARTNLGLTTTATTDINTILLKAGNLAGLTNVAQARANLGLGSAATANAGDFLSAGRNLSDLNNVQTARNNLGLKGCATLEAWGLPAGAQALDFQSSQANLDSGYAHLPNGIIMQWGRGPALSDDRSVIVQLPKPARILNVQVTVLGTFNASIGPGAYMTDLWTNSTFRVSCNWGNWPYAFNWFALTSTL